MVDLLRRPPGAVHERDEAVVDEHRQQLLDEQGIPFGGGHDAALDVLVEPRLAKEVVGDRTRLVVCQRLELDADRPLARRPVGLPLDELSARGADEENRRLCRFQDVLDELEERRLRPVDVVEHDDERSFGGERFEELARAPEKLLHGKRDGREPDRRLDALDDIVVSRKPAQLRMRGLHRVALGDGSDLAHRFRERPERDAVAIRKAPATEHRRAVVERADELVHEP